MKVEIIAHTPDPEAVAEICGRTCYKSAAKNEEKRAVFLRNIIKSGHESVIEHATCTMRFSGVSRSLTHQLVRHRLFSFSQESQRYVNQTDAQYVIPPVIAADEHAKSIFESCMCHIWDSYDKLINMGFKKEQARALLPNACTTEICVTGNFREWRHFIDLRADIHAEAEIRHLAHLVCDELCKIAPNIFGDLQEKYKDTDSDYR